LGRILRPGSSRTRKVLAYSIILLVAFFSLWTTNVLLVKFGGSQLPGPPRPVLIDVGLNLENLSADQYGLIADVYATFTTNTKPPSEVMTLVYHDASSAEGSANVTFGPSFAQSFSASANLTLRLFGDPANFPFDRYDGGIICKFLSSSGETWMSLNVSPQLTITPEIESKWWVLPKIDGSSYELLVVRNPFVTFVRFGWLVVAVLLLPLSLLIRHDKLTDRLAMIIAVLLGLLGFGPASAPSGLATKYDSLVLWLWLSALLLIIYCVLSSRSEIEDRQTKWIVGMCFLPIPVFEFAFIFEQVFVQSQYSQAGAEMWISTLDAGLAVSLLFLATTNIFAWKGVRWEATPSSFFRGTAVFEVVLFLPFAFILYTLEMANPFKIPALLIYLALVLLSVVSIKSQFRAFDMSVMAIGNLAFLSLLAYNVAQEWSEVSYSPLVHVVKAKIAPGFYPFFQRDVLWATLAILLNFVLLIPTLIPFLLIEALGINQIHSNQLQEKNAST
jgi:hypothetical protein